MDERTFFDFYESKGWMVGTSRMKDWRACVRTWERRNRAGAMWGKENEVSDEYLDLI